MERVEIKLKKTKLLLLLAGALIFVVLGLLFVLIPGSFLMPFLATKTLVTVVGFISVLFFGFVAFYLTKNILKPKIGLIIDKDGITDHTSATGAGLIEWEDILRTEPAQIMVSKFLLVFVNQPQKYIDREKGFKKQAMKGNYGMYGTPLALTAVSLDCSFKEMQTLISQALENFKKKAC